MAQLSGFLKKRRNIKWNVLTQFFKDAQDFGQNMALKCLYYSTSDNFLKIKDMTLRTY